MLDCFNMASVKTVLYLGVCLSAWIITSAGGNLVPKAENVRWVSLDFKTILTWTAKPSNYKYTVVYSRFLVAVNNCIQQFFCKEELNVLDYLCVTTVPLKSNRRAGGDWLDSQHCIRVSESECDLTFDLVPYDRSYTADIKTEPDTLDYDYDLEEFPHTDSPSFNPYRESNISAVNFTVQAVDEKVMVHIIDPLTSIHQTDKQLSIRDILKKDLKYKISYYKAGSTGKRDIISDSSTAEVSGLDAGQSYCFMVAAFIPSRPKGTQQGAWGIQQCTPGEPNIVQDISLGAWVGIVFIMLTVLIIIITVTVLCCKCCRQKNPSQSSASV